MNSGITLTDVRNEAFDTIKKLKEGKIDVKVAQEVRGLLNTVIDTAKTQVEFLKSLPAKAKETLKVDEIKAIAGTLKDRDAELDLSLKQIEDNKNKI
jgi:hypothetical protein